MHNIDDYASVVPSEAFDRALKEALAWADDSIVALVNRIAKYPYEEELVRRCQQRPPDNLEDFYYKSPKGFELYWEVQLETRGLPLVKDMRVVLTMLRAVSPNPQGRWLNDLSGPHY